jgi:hypothetical protein
MTSSSSGRGGFLGAANSTWHFGQVSSLPGRGGRVDFSDVRHSGHLSV